MITSKRLELIGAIADFESIGGKDDVKGSLLAILASSEEGVAFPLLVSAFPEAELLKARDELKIEKKIHQDGKRGDYKLKLIATE